MYSIVIADKIPYIYEDMALMICQYLINRGQPVYIDICSQVEEYKQREPFLKNNVIYLGQLVSEINIKPGSIITDFDPINFDLISVLPEKTIKANKFLCYSDKVIQHIKSKFPFINISKFRFCYSEFLDINTLRCSEYYGKKFTKYSEADKQYDVTFLMGNYVYPRRNKIINILIACGLNVYHDNHTHRQDRMEIYSKSKIILSIYSKKENLEYSSGSRIFPAVSSGCFVISEKCINKEENEILESICINVPYESIVTTVLYYLKNYTERIDKNTKFYDNIKKINFKLDIDI